VGLCGPQVNKAGNVVVFSRFLGALPMKMRILVPALVAVSFVLTASNAQAFDLLNRLSGHGSCCEPTCCAPEPTCCAPEPTCCAPEPSCCDADPCCKPRGHRLMGWLKSRLHRHRSSCCEPVCAPEPTCCAPEPTCCAPEPTCCAPEPCCKPHHRLFGWLKRGCKSSCCDSVCDSCGGGGCSSCGH